MPREAALEKAKNKILKRLRAFRVKVRTLKEKHLTQEHNSRLTSHIFRQKKKIFGSNWKTLSTISHTHACIHEVPAVHLPPSRVGSSLRQRGAQALGACILALSLPSCVTLSRLPKMAEPCSPHPSSADNASSYLLLSLIMLIICSDHWAYSIV